VDELYKSISGHPEFNSDNVDLSDQEIVLHTNKAAPQIEKPLK